MSSKARGGTTHPDRDAQFRHIADKVAEMQREAEPVISVDTKKKELVGDFSNRGREWQPHGVYDLSANDGWVSVGVDHDTAAFAVETIRRW